MLVEVMRKAYLASIVPVIVNAILNEHQLVVDIIAFVAKGDFPRSRLGEKQRGKILASWVTRKMRTIAQFGIRDADGADSQITEVAEPRSGMASLRNGSLIGGQSSIRNVESSPAMVEHQQRMGRHDEKNDVLLPAGISEMPADYADSIQQSPPLPNEDQKSFQSDDTPTDTKIDYLELADHHGIPNDPPAEVPSQYDEHDNQQPHHYNQAITSEPYADTNHYSLPPYARYDDTPTLSLPSVTGHESLMPEGDLWTLPSQQQSRQAAGGGLRVANASSDDEEEWPQEAIMHMNLAGGGRRLSATKRESRYDGSDYGGLA